MNEVGGILIKYLNNVIPMHDKGSMNERDEQEVRDSQTDPMMKKSTI
jgi:hypothetical protein